MERIRTSSIETSIPKMDRLHFFLWWSGITFTMGFLLFLYHYLAELAEYNYIPILYPFITEMTGALGSGLLFLLLLPFIRRFPLDDGAFVRRLPLYFIALLVFAGSATTFMWGSRAILMPLAGLGKYDYGAMPLRYFMELPIQVVGFSIMVGAVHAARHYRAARARELRTAQLETSLAREQLRSLRLQLQPHFLFNALNTISSTMYDDPAAADEMLDRLSELLRISLRTSQTDEVPLVTELDTLDCYLSIMRARFGERLDVTIEVPESLGDAMVPSMFLQPLVENAIRHGNAERQGHGSIRVHAAGLDGHLALAIEDDGPGASEADGEGIGLSSAAERLRLLYGDDQSFDARPGSEGGFVVNVRIPLRWRKERAT